MCNTFYCIWKIIFINISKINQLDMLKLPSYNSFVMASDMSTGTLLSIKHMKECRTYTEFRKNAKLFQDVY